MDQNINDSKSHLWNSFFENRLFRECNLFISVHPCQWTSSKFFNFRSSSRKSQCQKKESFYNTVLLKESPSFYEPQLTWHENNMLPQHSQQPFWLYKVSMKYVSVWCQKNSFSLNHFLKPKNYIVEANFGMFLYISVR